MNQYLVIAVRSQIAVFCDDLSSAIKHSDKLASAYVYDRIEVYERYIDSAGVAQFGLVKAIDCGLIKYDGSLIFEES